MKKQSQTVLENVYTASFEIREDNVLLIQPTIDLTELLKKCTVDFSNCKKIEIEKTIVKCGIENSEKLGAFLNSKMNFKKDSFVNISTNRFNERQKSFVIREVLNSDLNLKQKVIKLLNIYMNNNTKEILRSVKETFGRKKQCSVKGDFLGEVCVVLNIISFSNFFNSNLNIPNLKDNVNSNSLYTISSSKMKLNKNKGNKQSRKVVVIGKMSMTVDKIHALFARLCPNTIFRDEHLESLASLDVKGTWKNRIICDGKMMSNRQKYAIKETAKEQKETLLIRSTDNNKMWLNELANYKKNPAIAEHWNALHILGITKALYHKKTGTIFSGSFTNNAGRDRKAAADSKRIMIRMGKSAADIGNYLVWAFDKKFDQVNNPAIFINILFKEKTIHEYYHSRGAMKGRNRSY